jgi:hypothetical protein
MKHGDIVKHFDVTGHCVLGRGICLVPSYKRIDTLRMKLSYLVSLRFNDYDMKSWKKQVSFKSRRTVALLYLPNSFLKKRKFRKCQL